MKQWLSDKWPRKPTTLAEGREAELDRPPELPDRTGTSRQQLAKSSVRKYQTMERAVCDDWPAACSCFTEPTAPGRWAGRLIQLQNLPQNHLGSGGSPRLVKSGDFEM